MGECLFSPSFAAESVFPHAFSWSKDGFLVTTSFESVKLLLPLFSAQSTLSNAFQLREVATEKKKKNTQVVKSNALKAVTQKKRKKKTLSQKQMSQMAKPTSASMLHWLDDAENSNFAPPFGFFASAVGPSRFDTVSIIVPPSTLEQLSLNAKVSRREWHGHELAVLCNDGSALVVAPREDCRLTTATLPNKANIRLVGVALSGYFDKIEESGEVDKVSAISWFPRRLELRAGLSGDSVGRLKSSRVLSILVTARTKHFTMWGFGYEGDPVLLGSSRLASAEQSQGEVSSISCVMSSDLEDDDAKGLVAFVLVGLSCGTVLQVAVTSQPSSSSSSSSHALTCQAIRSLFRPHLHLSSSLGVPVEHMHCESVLPPPRPSANDPPSLVLATASNGLIIGFLLRSKAPEKVFQCWASGDVSSVALESHETDDEGAIQFQLLCGEFQERIASYAISEQSSACQQCPGRYCSDGIIVGLARDPLHLLVGSLAVLNVQHKRNNSVVGNKQNQQRLHVQLAWSGGGARALLARALRQVLAVLRGRVFHALGSWLMFLAKLEERKGDEEEEGDQSSEEGDHEDDESEDEESEIPQLVTTSSIQLMLSYQSQDYEKRKAQKISQMVEMEAKKTFSCEVCSLASTPELDLLSSHWEGVTTTGDLLRPQMCLLKCMHSAAWSLQKHQECRHDGFGHLRSQMPPNAPLLQSLIDAAWASQVMLRSSIWFSLPEVSRFFSSKNLTLSSLACQLEDPATSSAALEPLRRDLAAEIKRSCWKTPNMSELKSLIQMVHLSRDLENNCVASKGRWRHMYARNSGEVDHLAFFSAFPTPEEYRECLECYLMVLHGEDLDDLRTADGTVGLLVRLQQYLVSYLCPLCQSQNSLAAGCGGVNELVCTSCRFQTRRCMYTRLPLLCGSLEGGSDSLEESTCEDNKPCACHLCGNVSFCNAMRYFSCVQHKDEEDQYDSQPFTWLPYSRFQTVPNACLYCSLLLTDAI